MLMEGISVKDVVSLKLIAISIITSSRRVITMSLNIYVLRTV